MIAIGSLTAALTGVGAAVRFVPTARSLAQLNWRHALEAECVCDGDEIGLSDVWGSPLQVLLDPLLLLPPTKATVSRDQPDGPLAAALARALCGRSDCARVG